MAITLWKAGAIARLCAKRSWGCASHYKKIILTSLWLARMGVRRACLGNCDIRPGKNESGLDQHGSEEMIEFWVYSESGTNTAKKGIPCGQQLPEPPRHMPFLICFEVGLQEQA